MQQLDRASIFALDPASSITLSRTVKHLLFTFDHELFLGQRSGSVDRCIIKPTKRALKVLERYGLKAVFFMDTVYLMQLREHASSHPKLREDLARIEGHLADLVERGHQVFPHIHPHWLDARYNERTGQWALNDLSKYRFSDLPLDERKRLFDGSIEILSGMLAKGDPNHRIDAYRAGGWCIQPFTDFLPHFREHNIQFDLSVLAGDRSITNAVKYDFTSPLADPIYRFNDDVMVPTANGEFIELTISSILRPPHGLAESLLTKILWRMRYGKQIGDGIGVAFKDLENNNSSTQQKREMVSLELLTILRAPHYTKHVDQHDFTQFISHTKMISPHNLHMLDRLLKRANRKYELNTDWRELARKRTEPSLVAQSA